MSAPPYAELVTAVRREGEGIHTAAGLGLDAAIETLDGWTVADLVRHIGEIYTFVTAVLTTRATSAPQRPGFGGGELLEDFGRSLDDLVVALQDCDADTPVWNWTEGEPHLAAFWARRMAHESSVHRFDAQSAHGVVQPIDAELAGDGLDEFVDVIVPRVYARDSVAGPTGLVRLDSSDNGSWCLQLEPASVTRLDVLDEADATVHGTTSALLLAVYSRRPWSALETTGDAQLLAAWSDAVSF